MAVNLYRRTDFTGGTSSDGDGIDGAGLNEGDILWIDTGKEHYDRTTKKRNFRIYSLLV